MEVSRRDFLRLSVGTAGGTALAGLVGSGVNLGPTVARAQELRIKNAKVTPSLCPYCSVGCATLVHTVDGKIVQHQLRSAPHNEGTLCPEARQYSSCVNPNRPTQVLHGRRSPPGNDLERAMNRITELVKKTRDETFIEKLPNGKLVNMTPAIFSLGGATLEVEFNHVHQKLMRGLGIVAIENQARI
jgi:formate dehydrogenase major subunit